MVWVTIPDTDVDQDSPVTVALMSALRDNVKGALRGDPSAPIAHTGWHPYNKQTVGDSATGIFYDHAVDGNTNSPVFSPNFEDGYEYAFLWNGLTIDSNRPVDVHLVRSSNQSLIEVSEVFFNQGPITAGGQLRFPRFAQNQFTVSTFLVGNDHFIVNSAIPVVPLGVTDTIQSFRFNPDQTTITGGTCALYRRREYITG